MNNILYSKKTDIWETPKNIYNLFMDNHFFDPCPINPSFDGLEIEWKTKNFVNPPYSQINKWVDKAILESSKGKSVYLLVPSRTDTKWFKKIVDYGAIITFITGRLNFSNKGSAPFPSCIIKLKENDLKVDWVHKKEFEEDWS